jgi:hypothetical protein
MSTKGGRGIEDMLNLPNMDDFFEDVPETKDIVKDEDEDELPPAQVTDDHAKSMDDIYDETLQHSRDLMDLAYNVDERSRKGLFEIAVQMYGKAMDAKNSKKDSELKTMRLLLEERRLTLVEQEQNGGASSPTQDSVFVEDRNELLRRLRAEAQADSLAAENEKSED